MKYKVTLRRVVLVEAEVEADSVEAVRELMGNDCNDLDCFHDGQITSDELTVKSVRRTASNSAKNSSQKS